jgi:hypothetical protein
MTLHEPTKNNYERVTIQKLSLLIISACGLPEYYYFLYVCVLENSKHFKVLHTNCVA